MPKVPKKSGVRPKPYASGRNDNAVSLRGISTLARPKPSVKCSICNDRICLNACDQILLPCGHSFGEICADAWIFVNGRCPTCLCKLTHASHFPEASRYKRHLATVYIKAVKNAQVKLGMSGTVAGTLVAGGELVSSCVEKLALSAASFCSSASSNNILLRRNIYPWDRMNAHKLTMLKNVVQRVKTGAHISAKVSGCFSNAVGTAIWGLGSALAPALSQGSKAILAEFDVNQDTADRIVDGALEIAKGAFLCTGQVIRGFENAGVIIASSVASTMVREFEHSWGIAPGELSNDAGAIAGDLTATMWNTAALSPTTIGRFSRTFARQPYQPTVLNQIGTAAEQNQDLNYTSDEEN